MAAEPDDQTLLGIYLNDHLAGATAGTSLAARLAEAERGRPGADELRRLVGEIAEDRATLLEIMSTLDVPVRHYKVWGAWVVEKVGRLKFNGRLLERSPLSSLLELEMMMLGVVGKAAGWRTLKARAAIDQRLDQGRLDTLMERADRQSETLEKLRVRAAEHAVGGRG